MKSDIIESLLKAANSSSEGDTSVNMAKRTFLAERDAVTYFEEAKARLSKIDEWNKNSSVTSYDLFDEDGHLEDDDRISVGKFIRLSLYGSGKYDWVRVVSIQDEPTEFVIKVKPSYDPSQKPPDTSETSHFFGPTAENNFCIQLDGKTVAFYVIGLNERQNTKFADGLIESARNAAVANIGYYSGLQKAVWKEFCTSFLKVEEEKHTN